MGKSRITCSILLFAALIMVTCWFFDPNAVYDLTSHGVLEEALLIYPEPGQAEDDSSDAAEE